MPVIGFLHQGAPDVFAYLVQVFHQALEETGFVEGRNVAIWAAVDEESPPIGGEYERSWRGGEKASRSLSGFWLALVAAALPCKAQFFGLAGDFKRIAA